jgi:isoleucyl-tRNA synthetase
LFVIAFGLPLNLALKDKKKQPAYGTDVLRLWAATVDYWRDMPIGPTILAQAAESLRKIRNSARFILGNIGDEESQRVGKTEMGLVSLIFYSIRQSTYIHDGFSF